MGSEWEQITIGELIRQHGGEIKTGPFGTKLKASEYTPTGVPVISVGEIGFGCINISPKTPKVDSSVYLRMPEYILKTNDIVFGRKGAVERSALIKPEQDGWFLGSDGIRLRLPEKCNNQFIAYQFQTQEFQTWIHQHATGTTMASLNQRIIESIPIVLPSKHTQNHIAYILGTLDDKIELNRRMNRTLEQMAAAIFKSWFIDFDPVHAKANGDPTAGGLPPHIANLFPNTFQPTELGDIPEGWRVCKIGDIAKQTVGGQWGKENSDLKHTSVICLRGCDMADLREAGFANKAPIRWVKESAIKSRELLSTDILVAASGAGPCGRPLWCSPDMINQYDCPVLYSNFVKRLRVLSAPTAMYLDRFLYNKFLDGSIHDYINGTSVPNLDMKGLLDSCSLALPSDEVLKCFHDACIPMFKKLYSSENNQLAQLRDTLLPKLLSGELSLPDAESLAEEASQ